MADLAERYQLRRAARHPRAEHRAAACPQGRSLRAVAGARRAPGSATRQSRSDQRHHRLPRPRLLQPRQCPLDPGRAEDRRALRQPRPPARSRRAEAQDHRAASTPAAITMPATSASSASTGRAPRTTSCCSADRARRMRASAKITGPGFDEDGVVDAVETRDRHLSAPCASRRRALPRHLSPRRLRARSRRRSMGDAAPLPRRRARMRSPRSRSTRSSARPTPPRCGSSRATMRARCSRISIGSR